MDDIVITMQAHSLHTGTAPGAKHDECAQCHGEDASHCARDKSCYKSCCFDAGTNTFPGKCVGWMKTTATHQTHGHPQTQTCTWTWSRPRIEAWAWAMIFIKRKYVVIN